MATRTRVAEFEGVTLADLIDRNAGFAPDKTALRCGNAQLTYTEFAARIDAAAHGLATTLGIKHGDRVAWLGVNSNDFLVALFAAARLGAIFVPLNWRLAAPEHVYMMTDVAPQALVVEPAFAGRTDLLAAAAPGCRVVSVGGAIERADTTFEALTATGRATAHVCGQLSDPLLIVYTSGTTGRPKGAVLTQAAILANATNAIHMHGLTAADRVLTVLPLFHVGGLNIQTTPALFAGAEVTLLPRFDAVATFDAIATHRPTFTVFVPPILQAMLDHPRFASADLGCLRAITTGSTIVPEHLVTSYAARGLRVLQVYGATETCPVVVYERFDTPRGQAGSTGVTALLNETRVVDDRSEPVPDGTVGEIAVRGPNIFSGYWRDAAATAAALTDGWFLSGDIGVRDARGHFTVLERKKNVIISGGENIYAAEVERVVATFPGVIECAVVGRPDPRWQEVPVAFVVTSSGGALDIPALAAHLAASLARYKLPREIIVRPELPKNALGKIQHFTLRAELAAK